MRELSLQFFNCYLLQWFIIFIIIVFDWIKGKHVWKQITYDVNNRDKFDNIDKVFEEVQSLADENVTLMLCGNKIDKSDEIVISAEEGYSMATKYNAAFIETSAKEGTNIGKLFELIAAKVKDKKELDSSYWVV